MDSCLNYVLFGTAQLVIAGVAWFLAYQEKKEVKRVLEEQRRNFLTPVI